MTAGANKTNMDKDSIISAISSVIRSCQTRAESKKYLADHPDLALKQASAPAVQASGPTVQTPEIMRMPAPESDLESEVSSAGVDSDHTPPSSPASSPKKKKLQNS